MMIRSVAEFAVWWSNFSSFVLVYVFEFQIIFITIVWRLLKTRSIWSSSEFFGWIIMNLNIKSHVIYKLNFENHSTLSPMWNHIRFLRTDILFRLEMCLRNSIIHSLYYSMHLQFRFQKCTYFKTQVSKKWQEVGCQRTKIKECNRRGTSNQCIYALFYTGLKRLPFNASVLLCSDTFFFFRIHI